MSYFYDGRRTSIQRNLNTPPKKPGYFYGSCTRPGRTQGRIYDLFFVRTKLGS